jgi:hypothetical protein
MGRTAGYLLYNIYSPHTVFKNIDAGKFCFPPKLALMAEYQSFYYYSNFMKFNFSKARTGLLLEFTVQVIDMLVSLQMQRVLFHSDKLYPFQ